VGEQGEQAPCTFITDPSQFHNALNDPRGIISTADALRAAVRTATGN
jgi:hypothetical protein